MNVTPSRTQLLLAVCLLLAPLTSSLAAEPTLSLPLKITVEAGKHERRHTPVSVEIPWWILRKDPSLQFVETTGGKSTPVPAQLERGRPAWGFLITGTTPAGGKVSW